MSDIYVTTGRSPFLAAGTVLLHLSTLAQNGKMALKQLEVSLQQSFLDTDNFILNGFLSPELKYVA